MGIEQRVSLPADGPPVWPAVRDLLAKLGYPVAVRMIDGELAFPDEQPPDSWRELRLGTPQGMVTVRRDGNDIRCVAWGNADAQLTQAWNAITWAVAAVTGGRVIDSTGSYTADEFRGRAELPPAFQMAS